MLKKEGNSLVYTTQHGEIIKQFRKAWERNDNGSLDKLMADIVERDKLEVLNKPIVAMSDDVDEESVQGE
jgi:hypothetical protein